MSNYFYGFALTCGHNESSKAKCFRTNSEDESKIWVLPAPRNEIRYIISCEKGSTFGSWQKVNTPHSKNRSSQTWCHRFCHWFLACLPSNQVFLGRFSNIVRVLQIDKRKIEPKIRTNKLFFLYIHYSA